MDKVALSLLKRSLTPEGAAHAAGYGAVAGVILDRSAEIHVHDAHSITATGAPANSHGPDPSLDGRGVMLRMRRFGRQGTDVISIGRKTCRDDAQGGPREREA